MADFEIRVPQSDIDSLQARLARLRWPTAIDGAGWDRGTDPDYLRGLVDHWRTAFDWRAVETRLNRLPQLTLDVFGLDIHVVHQRGADAGAVPLLLLHGWPDCFVRYEKALPLLSDYHVVVPSLPGYGFSGQPTQPGWSSGRIADAMVALMGQLGYDRFVVSGGDVGSGVGERIVLQHPDRLIGLHLTDVPYRHLFAVDEGDLSAAEQEYLDRGREWQMAEGAYGLLQSTKPATAAYGLADSPVGLAGWIVEKLRAWSDCGGDISSRFSYDDVLTIVSIYWFTNTIGSSFTVYYEQDDDGPGDTHGVPTGVSIFPHDIVSAPREFGERVFDVIRWTEHPRGGHFAAMEEPQLYADDLRAFVAQLGDRR